MIVHNTIIKGILVCIKVSETGGGKKESFTAPSLFVHVVAFLHLYIFLKYISISVLYIFQLALQMH